MPGDGIRRCEEVEGSHGRLPRGRDAVLALLCGWRYATNVTGDGQTTPSAILHLAAGIAASPGGRTQWIAGVSGGLIAGTRLT